MNDSRTTNNACPPKPKAKALWRRRKRRKRKSGFILLLTLIFMTVLTVFTGSLIYMTTTGMKNVASQSDDVNLGGLADAGIDRAHREIRDDYLTTTSQGAADLRGADTSLSENIPDAANISYIDGVTATIDNNNDKAILRIFDSNYTNTRIIAIEAHAIASRSSGGGKDATNPTMEIAYTTDGATYTTIITQGLSSTSLRDFSASLPGSLAWSTIMNSDFRLRAIRTNGTRSINLDAMYLVVTCGIDTLKENWSTGKYEKFPISLGAGEVESIAVTDEAGKAHLNYASQVFLENLLTNLGVSGASEKAEEIVDYRAANPFDTVEELQQVAGIGAEYYNSIKDYVTVYSFVNSYVYRLAGTRSPVNINTAPFEVLKAIFDPLGLAAGNSTTLANDIIAARSSKPFTCFYSSQTTVKTDFYDFVTGRGYLTAAEQNIVLDNCDASSLIPVSGYAGFNCATTELCYAGNVFYINTLSRVGTRRLRVKTLIGNDGSRTFSTYTAEPEPYSGWRKENFE